jgi:hypothetical protein
LGIDGSEGRSSGQPAIGPGTQSAAQLLSKPEVVERTVSLLPLITSMLTAGWAFSAMSNRSLRKIKEKSVRSGIISRIL